MSYEPGANGGQKRVLELIELYLQVVGSNPAWVLETDSSYHLSNPFLNIFKLENNVLIICCFLGHFEGHFSSAFKTLVMSKQTFFLCS